ncbi:MAG: DUF294 nucleotidyltransferase-like domain-containing protein [Cytophagales bacterium]|nr:DUF294 nucleotidyltransferase-like domain-containing protein [Bernardetiaceae bacterium]MDW8211602.1 DUF294 nucleotidyltransferase-like domain-containing protein [Cytophagales bacterium]
MTASNPIASRLAHFLAQHLPYSNLSEEERLSLTSQARLQHLPKDGIFFRAGEQQTGWVYVVYKGLVHLMLHGSIELFDTAEPGDTFGIRAVLSGKPYVMTAICAQETLAIAIPVERFMPLLQQNARFLSYFAAGLASGMLPRYQELDTLQQPADLFFPEAVSLASLVSNRQLVWASPDTPLPQVAQLMLQKSVGSVVLTDAEGKVAGILTDKDLRRALAEQADPLRCKAADIMSKPVVCIAPTSSWLEAYLQMTTHSIRHLVITADGSPATAPQAVVSEHDLLGSSSPALISLLRRLSNATDTETLAHLRNQAEIRLKRLLQNNIPLQTLSQLAARINQLTVEVAIRLAQQTLPATPAHGWCWLALGSFARHEQILRTDQDNALLFADELTVQRPALLEFARQVNRILETCGYQACPAEVMASNSRWCLSLSEWKRQLSYWIDTPEPKAVMLTTIFFDMLPVGGDISLYKDLLAYRKELLSEQPRFLSFLAANALSSPPAFNWLGELATESEGSHKNQFDLKARALAPYADIARLLALQHGLEENSTSARFHQVAQREPNHTILLQDAARAYEHLLQLRMKRAVAQADSGRWLQLSSLSPLERQVLKKALMPLRELRSIIQVRFHTNLFRP